MVHGTAIDASSRVGSKLPLPLPPFTVTCPPKCDDFIALSYNKHANKQTNQQPNQKNEQQASSPSRYFNGTWTPWRGSRTPTCNAGGDDDVCIPPHPPAPPAPPGPPAPPTPPRPGRVKLCPPHPHHFFFFLLILSASLKYNDGVFYADVRCIDNTLYMSIRLYVYTYVTFFRPGDGSFDGIKINAGGGCTASGWCSGPSFSGNCLTPTPIYFVLFFETRGHCDGWRGGALLRCLPPLDESYG